DISRRFPFQKLKKYNMSQNIIEIYDSSSDEEFELPSLEILFPLISAEAKVKGDTKKDYLRLLPIQVPEISSATTTK
ncbi:unnamed protein product, partial [Larinioides sclopetarius]